MNDWLDYAGSGSSRAYMSEYIEHYGVKGMKWDPSKLFGKSQKEKEQEANSRLIEARREKANKLADEANKLDKQLADLESEIDQNKRIVKEFSAYLKKEEAERAALARTGSVLAANQKYDASIYRYKRRIKEAQDAIAECEEKHASINKKSDEIWQEVLKIRRDADLSETYHTMPSMRRR